MENRKKICETCPFWLPQFNTCDKCACPADWLFNNEEAICPESKW